MKRYVSFLGNVEYDTEQNVTDNNLLRCPRGRCVSYGDTGMTHYDEKTATIQFTTYGNPRTAVIITGVRLVGAYLCPTP